MLGHKDEDDEKLPRVVESLLGRDISMVACGVKHTIALSGQSIVNNSVMNNGTCAHAIITYSIPVICV